MAVPENMWECPVCGDYVPNGMRICPHCDKKNRNVSAPVPPRVSESAAVQEKYILEPVNTTSESWASKFLKVIAIILFIGGLIIAYMSANIEVEGYYYSYNDFSWTIFIETYLLYGLGGCFTLCASELFENIQRIADSLSRMEIRKK